MAEAAPTPENKPVPAENLPAAPAATGTDTSGVIPTPQAAVEQQLTAPEPTPEPADLGYPEYDDPAAQVIMGFFKDAKIPATEASKFFAEAVKTLDVSKADWAALEKRLGATTAAALKMAATDFYSRTNARVQAIVTEVHSAVGGKENWEQIKKWAGEKKTTDTAFATKLDELNKMFSIGAAPAKLAAQELLAAYNGDKGNTTLNANIVNGDGSPAPVTDVPTNRKEYIALLEAAEKSGNTEEAARLRAARRSYLSK